MCAGFLLVELSVHCFFLIGMSSFLAHFYYTLNTHSLASERTIQAFFLARSCLEEFRILKKVPLAHEGVFTITPSIQYPSGVHEWVLYRVSVAWFNGRGMQSVVVQRMVPQW